MIEALKLNKKLIINTDLDGVLSGLILQEFLGCEIVGFCNSDNKLWLIEEEKSHYKQFTFIDMFVVNKDITCIDQHIISYDEQHSFLLKSHGNKINPNLIRGRFFSSTSSYIKKYPFGTVHFIIAELEKNGLDLEKIKLFSAENTLNPIDFFLRADDALLTSVEKYKENAKDWWEWLKNYSCEGKITNKFIDYVYSDINAFELKKEVETLLLAKPFYCKKPDGGFFEILDSENRLLPNFKLYLDFIAREINLSPLMMKENFMVLEGIPKRINFKIADFSELMAHSTVSGKKVFSYAFVKSQGKENSFSFTYFEK